MTRLRQHKPQVQSRSDSVVLTDESVLNETKLPSDPVTLDSDKYLTNDDTRDLKVLDRVHPSHVAGSVVPPAGGPNDSEEGGQVPDGEEGGSLGEQAETANHVAGAVRFQGGEGILRGGEAEEGEISKREGEGGGPVRHDQSSAQGAD